MSNFNEVKNKTLQAYNRAMYAITLLHTVGEEEATRYLGEFSAKDFVMIEDTTAFLETIGESTFKRGLTAKLGVV